MGLSIIVYILIYFLLLQKNYKPIKIAETVIFIIHSFSHLITIIINPGIPNRKYYIKFLKDRDDRDYNLFECKKCNIIVPKEMNVSHCYNCGVCVIDKDHHSFWMGKCIGKYNWFIYNVSLFSASIYLVMSILSLMLGIIYVHEENIKIQKMNKA